MVTPELQFSGFLFDEKSAKKQPVRIELTPYHITLIFSSRSAGSWPYSDIRWAAETTPFHIEHQLNTPEGERLETLVMENPNFYKTAKEQPRIISFANNKKYFQLENNFRGILNPPFNFLMQYLKFFHIILWANSQIKFQQSARRQSETRFYLPSRQKIILTQE